MKTFWTLFRFALGFVFVALASCVAIVASLVLLPWRVGRIRVGNYYGKVVGPTVVWLAGVKTVVHHRERLNASMPAIYVANHTSTLDLFLSIWLGPVDACGVLKKEVVYIPFFGPLVWLSGHLLIDRKNHQSAVESLRQTAELMKKHHLGAFIMPEGTRSPDGRLLPFKRGFVHLAVATGLKVVPLVYPGLHRTWKKGSLKLQSMTCHVQVLEPIDTSHWKEETAAQHAEDVRRRMAEALPEEQRPLPAST